MRSQTESHYKGTRYAASTLRCRWHQATTTSAYARTTHSSGSARTASRKHSSSTTSSTSHQPPCAPSGTGSTDRASCPDRAPKCSSTTTPSTPTPTRSARRKAGPQNSVSLNLQTESDSWRLGTQKFQTRSTTESWFTTRHTTNSDMPDTTAPDSRNSHSKTSTSPRSTSTTLEWTSSWETGEED